MKTVFLLLLAAIAINLTLSEQVYSASDFEDWNQFKVDHGRSFDAAEDTRRMGIYVGNKKRIQEHNAKFAKGEVTFQMGINAFSDRYPEELPRGGLRT